MIEKIAVEVDVKNVTNIFGQNCQKLFFSNAFFTSSKNVGPNMKPYSERLLSEFHENGKKKLPGA